MTLREATSVDQGRPPGRLGAAVVAIVLLTAVALLYFGDFTRAKPVDQSAIGLEGLSVWLNHNDIDARLFYGGEGLDADDVGLRVLPLYDVNLGFDPDDQRTQAEQEAADNLREMTEDVLWSKIRSVPTLVILPKWRWQMPEIGVADRAFLIDQGGINALVNRQFTAAGRVQRPWESRAVLENAEGSEIVLHQPQFVEAGSCDPVFGDRDRMLLGRCLGDRGTTYWLLSDPDLLDNHGLTQGDNAGVALSQLPKLASSGPILIDLTTRIWTFTTLEAPQRGWADLARFFDFPFSIIWAGLAVLAAFVLWRAWWRFGPIEQESDETTAPRASREVSIDVKARLLRLTGHDAAIVRNHIADRLLALSGEIIGPRRLPTDGKLEALLKVVSHRSSSLAVDLRNAIENARNLEKSSTNELLSFVDRVNELIARTRDEFGKPKGHR
ncbi:MAG: hypothetical protein AAFX39_01790 [Pseudomonadota bacterium]